MVNDLDYNEPRNGGECMTTREVIGMVAKHTGKSKIQVADEFLGILKQALTTKMQRNSIKFRDVCEMLDKAGMDIVFFDKLPEERRMVCVEWLIDDFKKMMESEDVDEEKKKSIQQCVSLLQEVETQEIKP